LEAVSLCREEGTELESLSECLLTIEMFLGDLGGLLQEVRETERGADWQQAADGLDGQTAGKKQFKFGFREIEMDRM
jgi:hypothetical protein